MVLTRSQTDRADMEERRAEELRQASTLSTTAPSSGANVAVLRGEVEMAHRGTAGTSRTSERSQEGRPLYPHTPPATHVRTHSSPISRDTTHGGSSEQYHEPDDNITVKYFSNKTQEFDAAGLQRPVGERPIRGERPAPGEAGRGERVSGGVQGRSTAAATAARVNMSRNSTALERRSSVASRASARSTSTIMRIQQAELNAELRLAEITRRELRLEADLIRKKLSVEVEAIRAESEAGSIMQEPESEQRVDDWFRGCDEEVKEGDTAPLEPEVSRPLATVHELRYQNDAGTGREVPREPRHITYDDDAYTPGPDQRARSPTPRRGRNRSNGRAIEQLAEAIEKMARVRPAPRQVYDLPTFSGTVDEWLPFKAAWRDSTNLYKFTAVENLARLRISLKGAAREAVAALLHVAADPEVIINTLEQCYGRPEIVIDRAMADIKRLPRIGTSAVDISNFAVKLQNIVCVIQSIDNRGYLLNPMLTRDVMDKLTPHLKSRWCDYACENFSDAEPELVTLSKFLKREADRALRFSYSSVGASTSTTPPVRTELKSNYRTHEQPRTFGPVKNRTNPVFNTTETEQCLCCGGSHETPKCRKLLSLNVSARWDWAKKQHVCFRCLAKRHRRQTCRAGPCGISGCRHSHHRILHSNENEAPHNSGTIAPAPAASVTRPAQVESLAPVAPEPTASASATVGTTMSIATVSATVLLKVIPIEIIGPTGCVKTHCLLDEGSTISLIDQELADAIGATGPAIPLRLKGIGATTSEAQSKKVAVEVRGRSGDSHILQLRTVRGLKLHKQEVSRALLNYEHLNGLDEACYDTAEPRMLIGADYWHLLVSKELRAGRINEPAASLTELGWVIYGKNPRLIRQNQDETILYMTEREGKELQALSKLVDFHFTIDSLGVSLNPKIKTQDKRATEIFEQTVRKLESQKYEVGQPWSNNEPVFPPNYVAAFNRLKGIERKLDRDEQLMSEYTAQVDNLLIKGYAEPAPPAMRNDKKAWFLPHFSVRNPNKPGKIRLVFDAAAEFQGHSLNSNLLEGPDLLQSLPGILFRFREGAFAFTADIQEMFLQIKIRKEDQPSQLFLWRGKDRVNPPEAYVMTSMIFGASSSPFLAHSVRNKTAMDNAQIYPAAVEPLVNNTYMDDVVVSCDTEEELVQVAEQVRLSCAEGGFTLRGWSANSPTLLNNIDPELRASMPTHLPHSSGEQKILGLFWNPNEDELGFNTTMVRVPTEVRTLQREPSKREALSAVMSIFDPLGLLSQVTIGAKIILQRTWELKVGWDEPLPAAEASDFKQWLNSLEDVAALRLPRRYEPTEIITHRELHIFTDASEQAYSAAAYWRTIDEQNNIHVSLIAGKAKVAPRKTQSIPRLELQAAVIGTRLAQSVSQHRNKPTQTYFWTDSRTVLHWVRDDARRYSPFVAHRLGEIAENTEPEQWRWVPTEQNVADDATRADYTRKVRSNDRWFTGPPFLHLPQSKWPTETMEPQTVENTEVCTHIIDEPNHLPDISRFSKYERLIRATARVLQFIDQCRKKTTGLKLQHVEQAEQLWFKKCQMDDFAKEIKVLKDGGRIPPTSQLFKLDPVLEDGVLRIRGRINAAPVTYNMKNPIILNGRHPVTKLLVLQAHCAAAHSSNERVVNDLRQNFWILHLRPTVRAVAHTCPTCIVNRAHPQVPAMGDLPLARIEPFSRPFTNCGIDYFGPMVVTIGRRREKRWVALFTYLTTRAVHLELVATLSTDSAVMALRRMAARRGWPRVIWSDNGTNFRGADTELRAAYIQWLPVLRDVALQRRTDWRFIPPGAPNQGGAWERLVRSVKVALTATLHSKTPKEEVLLTVLAEAEQTVNARPLTHVSVDPRDPEALTPSHFLIGGSTGSPVTGPCDEADRRTWRASQALADCFWARWVREYLPTLIPRRSPSGGERSLKVGDLVVVVDPNLPRNVWPRGQIEAVYPGPDGAVRSADVRTRAGVFRRPTTRLAVLPIQ